MYKSLSPVYKGITFALIGYSGFAISDASAKFLTDSYPVMLVIFYITFASALLLLCVSPWIGGAALPKAGLRKIHLLRAIMNFLVSVFIVFAFTALPLASIYTILFAMPFIAALLAIPLYKEAITPHRWFVIGLGFMGVLIAMRPGMAGFNLALLWPLAAAFCMAVMWVVSRSMEGETPFAMGFYSMLGPCLLSLPFAFGGFVLPDISHLINIAICGAGMSAGVLGLSMAFRSAPSTAVSPFHYTQMIWGLAFGYFIFGDVPDFYTMLGGGIIILSGLFLIFAEKKA